MKVIIANLAAAIVISSISGIYAVENTISLKQSEEKWTGSGIKEYYLKVDYKSFSPVSGIWELKVKEGKVYFCTFKGETAESCTGTAESFTMENIYKTARESGASDKKGPYIIEISYGSDGLIRSLAKRKNPHFKKKAMKDTGYKIQILEFVPLGGVYEKK